MAIPKASKPKAVAVRPGKPRVSRGVKRRPSKGTHRIPGYKLVTWKSECPGCGGQMTVRTTRYSYTELCDGRCERVRQIMSYNATEYFRQSTKKRRPLSA